MRNFFITLAALITALVPIFLFGVFFYFLEELALLVRAPVLFCYFIFGFILGSFKESIRDNFGRWWRFIWEVAEDKL